MCECIRIAAGIAIDIQTSNMGSLPIPSYMQPKVQETGMRSNELRFIEECEKELKRIKEENVQLRYQKELSERDYQNVMVENNGLISKLENLENIFVGAPIQKPSTGTPSIETEKYAISKVGFLFNRHSLSWRMSI